MKNASQQRFADRFEKLPDGGSYEGDAKSKYAQLCSDERMQRVWDLTAGLPDDRLLAFMKALLRAKLHCDVAPMCREYYEEACQALSDAQAALGRLMSALGRLDAIPRFLVSRTGLPGVSDYLRQVQVKLAEEHAITRKNMADEVGTRKIATAARTMFMADAVRLMREVFGKPHYDAVAAFTAVAYNEDDVDPEAVRAAFRNSKGSKTKRLFEPLK